MDEIIGVLRWPATPLWVVALAAMVALFKSWPAIMAKVNEARRDSEAAKAGDWTRLRGEIDRLDERCAQIEEREQECQRQLTDALHRIGELEGYNLGVGKANQEAAGIVAAERLKGR